MGFFNSLSVRIPLAVIGGILYSLLAYRILDLLGLSPDFSLAVSVFVFLLYLGSRLLLLFSGIDSPYYSRRERGSQPAILGDSLFHGTAQWVGGFYRYHDVVLFLFLVITSITFLGTGIIDLLRGDAFGSGFLNLLSPFFPPA